MLDKLDKFDKIDKLDKFHKFIIAAAGPACATPVVAKLLCPAAGRARKLVTTNFAYFLIKIKEFRTRQQAWGFCRPWEFIGSQEPEKSANSLEIHAFPCQTLKTHNVSELLRIGESL